MRSLERPRSRGINRAYNAEPQFFEAQKMVDNSSKSSTFCPNDIISRKNDAVNTGDTVNFENIKEINNELQRWFSILTPEYNRWQAGEYLDSFLLTTEWVNTEDERKSSRGIGEDGVDKLI